MQVSRKMAASALLALALSSCGSPPSASPSSAAQLKMAGDSGMFGAALPRIPSGTTQSFRTKMLCTTGGKVSITNVTPVNPTGGLAVAYWGIRPNPFQTGKGTDDPGDVTGTYPATSGFSTAPNAIVTGLCPPPGAEPNDVVSELAITVSKPSTANASAASFRIDYNAGGDTQHLDIPVELTLCDSADKTGICAKAN